MHKKCKMEHASDDLTLLQIKILSKIEKIVHFYQKSEKSKKRKTKMKDNLGSVENDDIQCVETQF